MTSAWPALLQRSCAECHAGKQKKGGLRNITSIETMIKEEYIVPGSPIDSFIYRTLITEDPEMRMPPEDAVHSPPLTEAEVAAVRQWIIDREQGPVVLQKN